MKFWYEKQNLFVREKTIVSLLGSLLVFLSLDQSKPAILAGFGLGLFALLIIIFFEYMAINYSEFSLYLNENHIIISFGDSERDYYWTDLVSVKEMNNGLYLKFHDGHILSVLKEICDYDVLKNMVSGKIEIATQERPAD